MAKPIVHPTDFSPASRPAFRQAVELARRMRRPVLVVHVVSPPVMVGGDMMMPPQIYEDLISSIRRGARRSLDRVVTQARARGARATGLLLEGSSAEAIVRAARGKRAEMIVMGTHGRSGLVRMMLGSVASRVIALARCPVLTVRGT